MSPPPRNFFALVALLVAGPGDSGFWPSGVGIAGFEEAEVLVKVVAVLVFYVFPLVLVAGALWLVVGR